jgi:hypothetical protein
VLLCCCAAVLLCCCAAVLLCCCAAVLLCCCAAVLLCCCLLLQSSMTTRAANDGGHTATAYEGGTFTSDDPDYKSQGGEFMGWCLGAFERRREAIYWRGFNLVLACAL